MFGVEFVLPPISYRVFITLLSFKKVVALLKNVKTAKRRHNSDNYPYIQRCESPFEYTDNYPDLKIWESCGTLQKLKSWETFGLARWRRPELRQPSLRHMSPMRWRPMVLMCSVLHIVHIAPKPKTYCQRRGPLLSYMSWTKSLEEMIFCKRSSTWLVHYMHYW